MCGNRHTADFLIILCQLVYSNAWGNGHAGGGSRLWCGGNSELLECTRVPAVWGEYTVYTSLFLPKPEVAFKRCSHCFPGQDIRRERGRGIWLCILVTALSSRSFMGTATLTVPWTTLTAILPLGRQHKILVYLL